MDTSNQASVEEEVLPTPLCSDDLSNNKNIDDLKDITREQVCDERKIENDNDITVLNIQSNELKLKSRIAQCKSVIDSLKLELNEEKARLEREVKMKQTNKDASSSIIVSGYDSYGYTSSTDLPLDDFPNNSCLHSLNIDKKLSCDENLMAYEKQLQKYQNTLNMAHNEKKNAIRKHMLAKAFRLKLLEVENQCNIELLRVKQSLQCLEPLKMIANKWKTNTDDIYNVNNFEFIPCYQELSGCNMHPPQEYCDNETSEKAINENNVDTVSAN